MNESLFDPTQLPKKPPTPERSGTVRIERPERNQIEMRIEALDDRIPWDHPVRTIWEFVERLDFDNVHAAFKSFAGGPGRSVKDRRILFAIWLYGYSEGIGSARRLDALCRRDDAYRWLAGDVALNYHTLADFRSRNPHAIDDLFAQCLGVLMNENLIDPTRIAAGGTKIRAKAKGSRFRTEPTLHEQVAAAKEHMEAVRKEGERGELEPRVRAARERHARERLAKCEKALTILAGLYAEKRKRKLDNPRVSVTDPEARIMKFGGSSAFHPAYNVQVASTLDTGVILAIEPTQHHGDWYGLEILVPAVRRNTGADVKLIVADQGYGNVTTLNLAESEKITLYMPTKEAALSPAYQAGEFCRNNSSWDMEVRYRQRSEDLWTKLSERMETDEAKELYRLRSQCELQNANLKDRMRMQAFHVQGLRKARQESQLAAMAHNWKRWAALRSQEAA